MDVTLENINDYCCGSMALVERDIVATLPDSLAKEVLAVLTAAHVSDAFGIRLELVCLKKVFYFLHLQASTLERQLAQLATFWHGEHERLPGSSHWHHSVRLTALSDARMQCVGVRAASLRCVGSPLLHSARRTHATAKMGCPSTKYDRGGLPGTAVLRQECPWS